MRALCVFKDEFKRTSWLLLISMGLMFMCNAILISQLNSVVLNVLTSGFLQPLIDIIPWYLPISLFLALFQARNSDLLSSMPYTTTGLYCLRLLYGVVFLALAGLVQLIVLYLIFNRYSFLIEDLAYTGQSLSAVCSYPRFLIVTIGAYIIATLAFTLIKNRLFASFGLFFAALLPELFFAPLSWFFETDFFDVICELKYNILFAKDSYIKVKPDILSLGYIVYSLVIIILFFAGMYTNKKNHEKGMDRIFCNEAVMVIYYMLLLLFALNIIDTLFIQGGL